MPVTTYTANKILDHLLKGTAWTQPTDLYVGLLTSLNPQTELTGTNYARVAANSSWGAASGAAASNNAEIAFPVAGSNWPSAVGVGIYDASVSGNLLAYGALATAKSINNGSQGKFPIGDIDLSMPTT